MIRRLTWWVGCSLALAVSALPAAHARAAEAFVVVGEGADADAVVALHDAAGAPGLLEHALVRIDADALATLVGATAGLQRARDLFFEGDAEQAIVDLHGWLDALEEQPDALAARADLAGLALDALITLVRAELAVGAPVQPTVERVTALFPTLVLDPDVYPPRVIESFAAAAAVASTRTIEIVTDEPGCILRVAGLDTGLGVTHVRTDTDARVQFTCEGRTSRLWRLPVGDEPVRFSSAADAAVVERGGIARVRVAAWEPRSVASLLRDVAVLVAAPVHGAGPTPELPTDMAPAPPTAAIAADHAGSGLSTLLAGGVDDDDRWVWLVVTAADVAAARAPRGAAAPLDVLECARARRCPAGIERWSLAGGWPSEAVADPRGIRAAAWVTGGLALALTASAGVAEALVADAVRDIDRCADRDACVIDGQIETYRNRASDRRLIANIGWGLAGASLAGAIATAVLAAQPAPGEARLQAAVIPVGDGAHATLRVRF